MLTWIVLAAIAQQPADTSQKLDYLRYTFKANKEAFAFGTFRFEYTKGNCASVSDARSEKFSKSIKERGLYVVDGANERYELLADAAALAAVTTRFDGNKEASLGFVFRTLTNGQVTLVDRLFLDGSNAFLKRPPEIFAGTSLFCNDAFFRFPLSLGNCRSVYGDLFAELTSVQEGKGTVTEIDFDSQLDGLPVCKLSYTFKRGTYTYWIDRNRGCLPVRLVVHFNKSNSDSIFEFSDFEKIANAGWLPKRQLHIWSDGHLADLVQITSVDATNRPPKSAFRLDFDTPVIASYLEKKLVYSARKSWSLLDLPSASSPDARSAPTPIASLSEMPGEIEPSVNSSTWIGAAALLAIILLAAVSLKIHLKRKSS